MAYVKSGATETLSRHTKKIIVAVVAVVVAILAVVIAYFANPQSMTELVLSDQKYTELVAAKNAKTAGESLSAVTDLTSEDRGFSGNGNLQFALNDYAIATLGGEDIAGTLENYLNSTSFAVSSKKIGQNSQLDLTWKDSTSDLLDLTYLKTENNRYLNFEQFGLGWLKLNSDENKATSVAEQLEELLTSDDETHQKAVKSAVTDAFQETADVLDYRMDKDLTLTVGGKTATGDRMNILAEQEDINQFLDAFFASLIAADEKQENTDWVSKEKTLQKSLAALIKEDGVSKLSLDLYVNSRNVVCGMDLLLKSEKSNISGSLVLVDDKEAGVAGSLRADDTQLLTFEQTKGDEEGTGTLELISGSLAVQLTYENMKMTEQGNLTGRFVTSAFAIPGHDDWGNCIVELVLSEDNGVETVGGSLNLEQVGSFILNMNLTQTDPDVITEPDDSQVSKLKGKKLSKAASTYFFSTLPEENKNYNKVYKNIIKAVYKTLLSDAASAAKLSS